MRAALVLLACVLATACQTTAPLYTPLPPDDPRAGWLLRRWAEGVNGRESLRAVARLSVDGTGRNPTRLRVRQNVWLSRPSRVRVEIQSPLRTPLGVLVTDGLQYSLDTADGIREMGSVHDALLWEVAHLDLTPAEAVILILGFPGMEQNLVPGRSYRGPDGRVRLDLVRADGHLVREIEFDVEGRLARVQTSGVDNVPPQVVEYSDYELVDDVPFAHRVAIESAESRATLVLSLVELNPELPLDTFQVDTTLIGEGA